MHACNKWRRTALGAALAGLAWTGTSMAIAKPYPEKSITLVVPYSTGGSADAAARLISSKMSETLGQTIVVENKTGATGRIAEDYVSGSRPDGYTILYHSFPYVINAAARMKASGGADSLKPVAMVTKAAMVLVVNANNKAKTLSDFVAEARANPNKVSYASFGVGSPAHLAGALLDQAANVSMIHVPYKGGAPAVVDVLGGHVDSYFSNVATAFPHLKSGKMRGLAVSSDTRIQALPDIPTVAESLNQPFDIIDWHGIFVPRGTPDEIVQKLSKAVQKAMADSHVRKTITDLGVEPVFVDAPQFPTWLASEEKKWSKLIRDKNIQLN